MTATSDTDLYYDPFDTEIDKDPHPLWRRLREEAPLYYNEKHDFFALSRFDDVDKALMNWDALSLRPRFDARDHQGQYHASTWDHPHGGPADPRSAPGTALPGLHAQEDERPRAQGARVLRPEPRSARRSRGVRLHRRPGRTDAHAHDRHAAGHPRTGPRGHPRPTRRGHAHRRRRGVPPPSTTISCRPEARCSPSTSIGEPSTPPTTS